MAWLSGKELSLIRTDKWVRTPYTLHNKNIVHNMKWLILPNKQVMLITKINPNDVLGFILDENHKLAPYRYIGKIIIE